MFPGSNNREQKMGTGNAPNAGSTQHHQTEGNPNDERQNAQSFNSLEHQMDESNIFEDFPFQLSAQMMNQLPSQSMDINAFGTHPQLGNVDNQVLADTLALMQPLMGNFACSTPDIAEMMQSSYGANPPSQNQAHLSGPSGFGTSYAGLTAPTFDSTNYCASSNIASASAAAQGNQSQSRDAIYSPNVHSNNVTVDDMSAMLAQTQTVHQQLGSMMNNANRNAFTFGGAVDGNQFAVDPLAGSLGTNELLDQSSGAGALAPTTASASAFNSSMSGAGAQSAPPMFASAGVTLDGSRLVASTAAGVATQDTTQPNFHSNIPLKSKETPLVLPKRAKSCIQSKEKFVLKLMQILSAKECQNAIRWMPTGNAFCILDVKELVEVVLPKYGFKETKYSSFVSL